MGVTVWDVLTWACAALAATAFAYSIKIRRAINRNYSSADFARRRQRALDAGVCMICGHPLDRRPLWDRVLFMPRYPMCRDVEPCFRRFVERVQRDARRDARGEL